MNLSWFCLFETADPQAALSPSDRQQATRLAAETPGLRRGLVYTPAPAHDPYSADGRGPALVLELEFDDLFAGERSLTAAGHLSALASPGLFASLGLVTVRQQGMLARHYPVPEPLREPPPEKFCTFLVHYPGPASDAPAWHYHYVRNHPPIMATLPGIRGLAVYTPAVVISGLPFAQAGAMQRNKVVFDSSAALTAALASPVREAMRRDFETLPAFEGGNRHFAMDTTVVSAVVNTGRAP